MNIEITDEEELIKHFVFLRKKKQIRQQDMAGLLGVGITTMANFEACKYYLKFDSLKKLSKILNLDITFSQGEIFVREN